ncbi:16S rRNA (uracil(1498)-N(3))-methyltransferase [Solemya velesiana gill symbiont]|uniref:Ribosomal RNA small subunit methyltransferase E n=1 Tax=Solemya velesiana gill symbiont TaxID=1918948 RepID=A0A1T2KW00_9GAMM|nr:16S rRNA (uracil(1498)-N(3))-methyltransferase [Solemya velesiana gill symbiont]OOZ37023.1 16S rRNA (uracil(1498)-N(3))-methyltransferase [Solemya velesiana gill symbiont]
MGEHRIYTQLPLAAGDVVSLEEGPPHHLLKVLRLKPGAELTLFNGNGCDYGARIIDAGKRSAQVEILDQGVEEATPALRISLGIGISKGERMDFAVQKAVELGVSEITPLITERCVVRLSRERMHKRCNHWRQVAISACEQSGRRRVPLVIDPMELDDWIESSDSTPGLLLEHRSERVIGQLPAPGTGIRLLVGPEGGLSEEERTFALRHRFTGVQLGPRVLRTETAPLAAIAAIQTLWGDFR